MCYRVFDLPNQKSKIIALYVASITRDLLANSLIMISHWINNARNEKATLDPKHDYSVQQPTSLPIIRLPCMTHTANFAVNDFLKVSAFSIFHRLHSRPTIKETRCVSSGERVMYVLQRYRSIETICFKKVETMLFFPFS
jgi:hypothetical protein